MYTNMHLQETYIERERDLTTIEKKKEAGDRETRRLIETNKRPKGGGLLEWL